MKYLLTALVMLVTTGSLAETDARLFDPFGKFIRIYTTPLSDGRVLYAEVQDNGQSCVYTFKSMVANHKLVGSGEISMKSIERRIEKGMKVSRVTAQSVDIDDVIDTLERLYDNSGKHSDLFVIAPEVLAGEYGLYQGTYAVGLVPSAINFLARKRIIASQLLNATQKTHSQGSVACAK